LSGKGERPLIKPESVRCFQLAVQLRAAKLMAELRFAVEPMADSDNIFDEQI